MVRLAVSRVATWGVLPQRRWGEDWDCSSHGLAVTGISANVLRSFGLGFVMYVDMRERKEIVQRLHGVCRWPSTRLARPRRKHDSAAGRG